MVWSESVVKVAVADGPGSALLSVTISSIVCVIMTAESEMEHILSL